MTELLNVNQLAAVFADEQPTLVVAGPGSGKTTVLTARIDRLFRESEGSYSRILGLTFTNVAATNLRDKVLGSGDKYYERIQIGTFHSFAAKLLQQHGSHIGLRPDFSIVNGSDDRASILKRASEKIDDKETTDLLDHPTRFLPLLARLFESCPSSADVVNSIDSGVDAKLVAALFDAYIDESIINNQLDFPLLVFLADRLLTSKPAICKQTRRVYKHICVDEFQDTNEAQFRLLCTLIGNDARGVFLVADQDQVIYEWNGASPQRLIEAQRRFGARILQLPTSYRCPEAIITAANALISHNAQRFIKPELSSLIQSPDPPIESYVFESARDEFAFIAAAVSQLSREQWAKSVVLARARKPLEQLLPYLTQRGVPAVLPVTKYQFSSPPVAMLYSLLKLGSRSNDEQSLRQLASAFYAMTGRSLDIERLKAEAEAREVNVLDVFASESSQMASSPEFMTLATIIMDDLSAQKQYRRVPAAVFAWVDQLSESEMKRAYLDDYREERATWEELERVHKGLESERLPLPEFLRTIDLAAKTGSFKGDVKLLTVHTAKGLEFDNVFVMAASEGQFPSFQAVKAGPHSASMEEERRSFFVAITRARKRLCLTRAKSYGGYAATRSRFLGEMGVCDLN